MPSLSDFDPDFFLRENWQKQPQFIKNPWDRWHNPLEPDELAGLACDDEVESRIVIKSVAKWTVDHGPFPENRFSTLDDRYWSLLVQAVDHYVPEVADLIDPFRFIPNWRIDDVMVSYAADEGGVGPHFDQYDVFLIQGLGKRRWQIGSECTGETVLQSNDELKLLQDFQPTQEWICEPGDILYLPPGISHNGEAIGQDCMTYSVGFRAPSRRELLAHWMDDIPDSISDERYRDPCLLPQEYPSEILPEAIEALHNMAGLEQVDKTEFAEWFGLYSSSPKYPDHGRVPDSPLSVKDLASMLKSGKTLKRNPASRFLFIRKDPQHLTLFVDGQMFECLGETAKLAVKLCDAPVIDRSIGPIECLKDMTLLSELYCQGSLEFD